LQQNPDNTPLFCDYATAMLDQPPREKQKPWIFRTYAGHSTAAASNALYRKNLSKGQTGLSVAFDLPTQTGYDSDHPLAKGEVGKVGVPISHLGDLRMLFDGIPLDEMNTSMTINATAAWLLALYIAVADEQSVPRENVHAAHRGRDFVHDQGDAECNPMNVCSYHLQEAGATPMGLGR
jgi:(2R)-ethylmalonyl-CoA mutase